MLVGNSIQRPQRLRLSARGSADQKSPQWIAFKVSGDGDGDAKQNVPDVLKRQIGAEGIEQVIDGGRDRDAARLANDVLFPLLMAAHSRRSLRGAMLAVGRAQTSPPRSHR
jgi:hypothetical protein